MATETAHPINDDEWEGLNRAECWDNACLFDGDPTKFPISRSVGDYYMVADPHGVEAHLWDEAKQDSFLWTWLVEFPTQACALAFLNGLPEDFNPITYGFEEF